METILAAIIAVVVFCVAWSDQRGSVAYVLAIFAGITAAFYTATNGATSEALFGWFFTVTLGAIGYLRNHLSPRS
jgi:drug/metabolite transporter (DMT)-like permease